MSTQSCNSGYGLISSYTLYVLNSPQKLREALQQIPDDSYCEIFSTPTLEEANFIMLQRFSQLATSFGLLIGCESPALPVNGEYAIQLPTPLLGQSTASSNPALQPSQNPTVTTVPANGEYMYGFSAPMMRFWGISFLQGFAVYSNPNVLLGLLSSPDYYYARAISYRTEQRASMMATFDYYNRFHQRYSINDTTPTMFNAYLKDGQFWIDDNFEDREIARSESELWKRLRDTGLW